MSDSHVADASKIALAARAGKAAASNMAGLFAPIANWAEILTVVAVLADLFITFVSTIFRYLFNSGLDWASDISSIAMPIIAFVGSAAYYRRGSGMAYTAVVDGTKGVLSDSLTAVGLFMTIALSACMLYAMPDFLVGEMMQTLPVLGINLAVTSVWMIAGFALFLLFAIEKMLRLPSRAQLIGLLATAVMALFLCYLQILSAEATLAVDPLAALGIILVIGFVCAVPMALVLAIGGLAFLFTTGSAPIVAAPAMLQAGVSSFLLVAVPFFLLAGALMEVTGMARRLIDLIQNWVGHWRGGLLMAQIVSMYVFSGMSGSKAADVATVGSVMKQPLRERGYPATESVAVLVASAAMGEVIPPSIALLILGSVTTLSIGTLFIAGIVPAALLAVALMAGVLVRSYRFGFPKGGAFSLRRALASVPPAIPALLVPVIVLGGIVGGVASPTESSSFAVTYGLLAAFFIFRSVDIATMWEALRSASVVAGMVLLMMSTANLLSQAIVIDGLGAKLGTLLEGLTNPTVFLFVSLAVIIVLGFVLEGFPAILITAPLMLPIAQRHGVDPLHYGILLTMAVGIGVFMPPVGIGYYIACAIGEASPHDALKPTLFYNFFLILGLILCIVFPGVILGLPRLLGR
jgi:C4-dicarboxylate transporter DctM subunit